MKLVVLEGVPLNTGDLSWDALSALGELTVYDRTAPEQIIERAKDAQALFVNKSILTRDILYALPNLRYIGLFSTGFNVVDLSAAKELGLVVTNIPAYSTYAVTQMVFALLLELTNQVSRHSEAVRAGAWSDSKDFCFWLTPLTELTGKTHGYHRYGADRATDRPGGPCHGDAGGGLLAPKKGTGFFRSALG